MPSSVASSEADDIEPCVDSGLVPIEDLANHQINASDIAKLKLANIHTIGQLRGTMKKNLEKIKGFSEIKCEKLKETATKCSSQSRFLTGAEVLEKRKTCFKIGTGSDQLNKILGGGFESRSVSEVYGEYRCGKTQLCLTMAVIAQLPVSRGGALGKVVIIDTEGTFRPERIMQIAGRFDIDPEQANDNLLIIRAANSEDQHDRLGELAQEFATGNYRLLIVDSILNLFRTDYVGRGQLSERQQNLGLHLRRLCDFAEEFNVAVLMTNHVQSDPGASALFSGADGRKPTGGHVMAHASTTRLLLRKGRGDERVAKLMDSPDCPEAEATYVITEGGINDPDKA